MAAADRSFELGEIEDVLRGRLLLASRQLVNGGTGLLPQGLLVLPHVVESILGKIGDACRANVMQIRRLIHVHSSPFLYISNRFEIYQDKIRCIPFLYAFASAAVTSLCIGNGRPRTSHAIN